MKNAPSDSHIIQLSPSFSQPSLSACFSVFLMLVGKIQGTARVVNYAGLVRGKTQRIVKLEISGTPEDDLLGDVAPTSKASASAAASWTWRGWTTRIFRPR